MKKPILVNELPVDDAKALELGLYRASDFESGGKELPRTSVVINRLGDKMQSVANIMLSQGSLPDDAKMSDLLSQNASKVLDYLVKGGCSFGNRGTDIAQGCYSHEAMDGRVA